MVDQGAGTHNPWVAPTGGATPSLACVSSSVNSFASSKPVSWVGAGRAEAGTFKISATRPRSFPSSNPTARRAKAGAGTAATASGRSSRRATRRDIGRRVVEVMGFIGEVYRAGGLESRVLKDFFYIFILIKTLQALEKTDRSFLVRTITGRSRSGRSHTR